MNWTLLFIMFILLFLTSMIIIYFSLKPAQINPSQFYGQLNNEQNLMWKW